MDIVLDILSILHTFGYMFEEPIKEIWSKKNSPQNISTTKKKHIFLTILKKTKITNWLNLENHKTQ